MGNVDENSITTGGVTTNSVIRLPNALSVREAESYSACIASAEALGALLVLPLVSPSRSNVLVASFWAPRSEKSFVCIARLTHIKVH